MADHRRLEEACIKALLADPTLVHYVDRALRGYELAPLHVEDFAQTDFKEAFKLIGQALEQELVAPSDYIQEHLPESIMDAMLGAAPVEAYPDWRFLIFANTPIRPPAIAPIRAPLRAPPATPPPRHHER